ncbi:chorismate--pyruvate lyase family protein [Vibrio aquimaris]|uniref:Chorismate pyruvate-lyase n=1 Tax=Vibrio aquimaris TaxID=2587862 RepID=A0A5P9CQR0_9VIBR|nr:chorismate lyase [Vibrio aquimaris]QFT28544.1 Chorismate pyruvate-lyase [Vibrio aquimaris]
MKMSSINEALVPEVLKYRGSLTRTLKSVCSNFNIQPLSQSKQSPLYRREVLLCDGDTPLVWAKSYLFSADRSTVNAFLDLDGRSLGEQLLFTGDSVSRGPYQFGVCSRGIEQFDLGYKFEKGIARLSKFSWHNHSTTLLLSEIFNENALALLESREEEIHRNFTTYKS